MVSILLLQVLGLVLDVKMNISVSWKYGRSLISQTEKQRSRSLTAVLFTSLILNKNAKVAFHSVSRTENLKKHFKKATYNA